MHQSKNKVAVIGGGSWATANIKILTDNATEKEIFWWMRSAEAVAHIHKFKHNPHYLSSVEVSVPANHISTNLKEIIAIADFIVLNIPAAFLKEALAGITPADFAQNQGIGQILMTYETSTKVFIRVFYSSRIILAMWRILILLSKSTILFHDLVSLLKLLHAN